MPVTQNSSALYTPPASDYRPAGRTLAPRTSFNIQTISERKAAEVMRAQRKRRIGRIFTAVLACLILAGCAFGIYAIYRNMQNQKAETEAEQAAYDAAHGLHEVVFTVSAPGYDDATCSKIPLHVTGTDVDGKSVDKIAYIDSAGKGLELIEGTYVIAVSASPLMPDGAIYDTPTTQWNVGIGSDVQVGAPITVPADQPIAFTRTAETNITEEQIDAAFKAAMSSGMDRTTADNLRAALVTARQNAINGVSASASSSTSSSASSGSEYHVKTDYYEFYIPDYWQGNVTVKTGTDNKTQVYISGTDQVILTVWLVDSVQDGNSGSLVAYYEGSKGKNVEFSMENGPYIVWNAAHNGTTTLNGTVQEMLIDLTTGGDISEKRVLETENWDDLNQTVKYICQSFFDDNIGSTIVVR